MAGKDHPGRVYNAVFSSPSKMRKWTEGHVHVIMRRALRNNGFLLVAGEYPGGSDHDLYPVNVTDPLLARDRSPDPRRHSYGEIIPDIVALKARKLFIGEAKVDYNEQDKIKLDYLLTKRRDDLSLALTKFAHERGRSELLPIETLTCHPLLIFTDRKAAPSVPDGFAFLVVSAHSEPRFMGSSVEGVVK